MNTVASETPGTTPKPAAEKPSTVGAAKTSPAKKPGGAALDETIWPQVLQALKQKHNTLYGVVRMAQPAFSRAGIVTLSFAFAFHQKRLDENSNRQKLADIIYELTGVEVTVECLLDKTASPPKVTPAAAKTPQPASLTTISNIFGGGELLES